MNRNRKSRIRYYLIFVILSLDNVNVIFLQILFVLYGLLLLVTVTEACSRHSEHSKCLLPDFFEKHEIMIKSQFLKTYLYKFAQMNQGRIQHSP